MSLSNAQRLLGSMARLRASDLFLATGKVPSMRVDGAIKSVDLPATTEKELDELLAEITTETSWKRFEATGDLDVAWTTADGRRYRFNIARQQGTVAVVCRALASGDLELRDLGLPEVIGAFADLPRGLVLVTGATGSGKSTTVAALVHRINRTRAVHIVTLEEPIEFVHTELRARITQREVGSDTESFVTALRHVVRQSPDVIVIGEMRDLETMQVAVTAALTGHLVIATVHTVDATQTLQRILSYFPEHQREQAAQDLALSLQAIVSQRLIPREDGPGRAVASEILTVTPPARRLIREQRVDELYDLMRSSTDPGVVTFNRSLLELFRAKYISFEIGRSYATNPEEFSLAAQGMSTGVASFRTDAELLGATGLDMRALLAVARDRGASDLHVTVGRPPILRVDGQMKALEVRPLTSADMRILLYSILSNQQRSQYELDREIDFALMLENGTRFRVNAYYQKGRMAASLRAIPTRIPSADELGLPSSIIELGARPHGLLLVVGPTGSGKSTTMACLIDRINRSHPCRIMTIEDPIEYTHEGVLATVDQREVFADTRSFAAALKYVLRQDPDVILVGEMRDLETIGAAITAAETGHLVLATLHTNDAISAVDRIIDVFPAYQQPQVRSQLASALAGVVSQRLLPKQGGGRVGAFEVLVATPAIRTLIRDNKLHQAISMMETSSIEGMITMDRALSELFTKGAISYEEAARYVRSPKALNDARQALMARQAMAAPLPGAPGPRPTGR